MKTIDLKAGDTKMNVYVFSQCDDPFEMYTDFTVVAKSKDDAWEQIKALFKGKREWWEKFTPDEWDEFTSDSFFNDRSQYKVVKLDLNAPKVIAHYSRG